MRRVLQGLVAVLVCAGMLAPGSVASGVPDHTSAHALPCQGGHKPPTVYGQYATVGGGYGALRADRFWHDKRPHQIFFDAGKPLWTSSYFGLGPAMDETGHPCGKMTARLRLRAGTIDHLGHGGSVPNRCVHLAPRHRYRAHVAPGTDIDNFAYLTAKRIDRRFRIPSTCLGGDLFVQYQAPLRHSGWCCAMGDTQLSPIRDAVGTPAEQYIDGKRPFEVVWKLGTKKEIAEVRKKGHLPSLSPDDLNYFFTKCKSAMQLRGMLLDQGHPSKFGLMKFRIGKEAVQDSLPQLIGMQVKFGSGKDRKGVMAQKGASHAFKVPDVIKMIKGAGACF